MYLQIKSLFIQTPKIVIERTTVKAECKVVVVIPRLCQGERVTSVWSREKLLASMHNI